MTLVFEKYVLYKINGAILSGTKTDPILTIKKYDHRSGQALADIVISVDTAILDSGIDDCQQKLNNLNQLKIDLKTLPA